MRFGVLSAFVALSGCSGDDAPPDANQEADAGVVADAGPTNDAGSQQNPTTLGQDRPATLVVPSTYQAGTPLPVVVLLHGYSASGAVQDMYFQLSTQAEAGEFFLIVPDGTMETSLLNNRFWNATPACCNFFGAPVDDVAYLLGLVDEAAASYDVDLDRVYFVGHSNGGFMSYRMACEHADRIAAIVSLAGSSFAEVTDCTPSEPVSVLQIHGTVDETISYEGGDLFGNDYPGAETLVSRWAERAGCDTNTVTTEDSIDLETSLSGSETEVEIYQTDCAAGVDVQLWRIVNGAHVPALASDFATRITEWMFTHSKTR